MLPEYISDAALVQFIVQALAEDVGPGDYTSLASIPITALGKARLLFKDNGIVAGIELSKHIFKFVDPSFSVEYFVNDGDVVKSGQIGLVVTGPEQNILKAERLVLNCMQRMSGIATLTAQYKEQIAHTKAKLLDTRKTTPNFRMMEKWAVRIGGGTNHRFGLYDMVLLKDNHIDYCGGVENAIKNTLKYLADNQLSLKIEIETRTIDEVKQVLNMGAVHRILLDNMPLDVLSEAVLLVNGVVDTEASGGVNLQTVKSIAETGVDYISVGQLTHSYKSLDISLKAIS